MKLTITHKLVFSFLALTLVILIATLLLARWSFERGFLDYVNALEQTRLEKISEVLSKQYVKSGSNWNFISMQKIEDLPSDMRRLLSSLASTHSSSHFDKKRGASSSNYQERLLHKRPGPFYRRGPATALFDQHGEYIAGSKNINSNISNAAVDYISVPIFIDEKPIGELRSKLRRLFNTPQETAFSKQQLRTSWLIGIVSLLLAMMISIFLAKRLLIPIRKMLGNVNQLSSGDYSVRLNEKRSDELGLLMNDLDHLAMTLEQGQSTRQRWLAEISHELRTPVAVLSGEVEGLKDGLREFNQEELASIDQEVKRLHYLINDLYELSLSDIGGLRYEFSVIDLKAYLDSVVEALQERVADQQIKLDLKSISVWINADSKRIIQLLTNLLENSLAYTDSPGQIEVALFQIDELAIVEINDTLPSVNHQDCEQLFEPLFRQESSRSRRTGGAGLGLSICRNIVKAHHGSISISPSKLGGLCVRIELPKIAPVST